MVQPFVQCNSITEVIARNKAVGQLWFSDDTMQWFNSHVYDRVYEGNYFISSERFDEKHPRLFTVRRLKEDGSIETIGEFQEYETHEDARWACESLATTWREEHRNKPGVEEEGSAP